MSASEKLKALKNDPHGDYEVASALCLALPQIEAVVSLVEDFWGDATPPYEFTRALSALDEALS